MSKKHFSNLHALVKEGVVELSFYMSTPLFLSHAGSECPVNVRIFRSEEQDFTFNHDYAEYFDGLMPGDAKVLFEGSVELINKRKIVYQDATVKTGSTYAYWVSPIDIDAPTGPVQVRVRDTELWWPQHKIEQRMKALADEYPQHVLLQNYGRTIRGKQIQGITAGNPKRLFAFIGAIHPGESGPELIIPALERILREHPELIAKIGVAILPSVCIDQREKMVQGNPWYLRKNFNEVDLNRNFPTQWENTEYTYGLITSDPDAATFRGDSPCSEPETRAVIEFIERTKPLCVYSYHCLAGICGPNFLTSKLAVDDVEFTERCKKHATSFQNGFYGSSDKETIVKFTGSAGSLTSWLYHEWNIPGFDLEWDGEDRSKVSHTDNVTRKLMVEYQDRHYKALLNVLQEGLSSASTAPLT